MGDACECLATPSEQPPAPHGLDVGGVEEGQQLQLRGHRDREQFGFQPEELADLLGPALPGEE